MQWTALQDLHACIYGNYLWMLGLVYIMYSVLIANNPMVYVPRLCVSILYTCYSNCSTLHCPLLIFFTYCRCCRTPCTMIRGLAQVLLHSHVVWSYIVINDHDICGMRFLLCSRSISLNQSPIPFLPLYSNTAVMINMVLPWACLRGLQIQCVIYGKIFFQQEIIDAESVLRARTVNCKHSYHIACSAHSTSTAVTQIFFWR